MSAALNTVSLGEYVVWKTN